MNIKSENQRLRGILLGAMEQKPMTRDELLTHTAECYCADGTGQSPAEVEELTHLIRSLAGTVLSALYREKQVTRDQNGRYSPAQGTNSSAKKESSVKKMPGLSQASANTEQAGEKKDRKSTNKAVAARQTTKTVVLPRTRMSKTEQASNPEAVSTAKATSTVDPETPFKAKDAVRAKAKKTVKAASANEWNVQELCEEILALLAQKPLRRGEMLNQLDEIIGVGGSVDATERLHRAVDEALRSLKSKKEITSSFGVYRIAAASTTQLARRSISQPTENTDKLRKRFLARLYARGGAYLEHYAMNLLIKYYQDSGKVIRGSKVTGGSADGGIDGILEITDWLGFRECIMIQTKCRGTIQVTEKEIREFYGVVCSRNGSRGIFITTSTFHASAGKLLASIDNCVGVDGEKLFLMARRCHYGICTGVQGDELDPEII